LESTCCLLELPICCLNHLLEKLLWFQAVPLGDLKEHFVFNGFQKN
jgi:hypothetical protein